MIEWKEERIIATNIEDIWELFSEENMPIIMPKVVKNVPVDIKEDVVGSKYEQTYQEGKRTETYIVETVGYEDSEEKKFKRIKFTLAKTFEVDLSFTLKKIDSDHTNFIYEGQNKGTRFIGKMITKLSSKRSNNKVVYEFIDRVEHQALKRSN